MVAAAVVGGVAAVGGAVAQKRASDKATKAQTQASQMATDAELEMYNQTREDLSPFREQGYRALGEITTGQMPGGDFNRDFTTADFEADPGYAFRMGEGTKAIERSAAARGGLLTGGTLKELNRFGQDFASNEYSNAYSRFNADRDRRFNRLASVAGIGQTAVNSTSQAGQAATAGIVDSINAAGNARAAGAIGQGNAINQGVGSLAQFYLANKFLKR